MKWVSVYKVAPCPQISAPAAWPSETTLGLNPDGYTLVLFAHPRCPCAMASVIELNVIMNRLQGSVRAHALFYKPPEAADAWVETGAWRRAREAPSTAVRIDPDGGEARRFHALTTGQTLLYDKNGRLVFQGGITPQRGHEGLNEGRRQIIDLVIKGKPPSFRPTPVFGCALFAKSTDHPGDAP